VAVSYGPVKTKLSTDYSVNMSSGGVFIETVSVLPVHTPLFVKFELPGREKPIVCKARVAWINGPEALKSPTLPPGMGLQFLGLSRAHVKAIEAVLTGDGTPVRGKLLPE